MDLDLRFGQPDDDDDVRSTLRSDGGTGWHAFDLGRRHLSYPAPQEKLSELLAW